MSTRERGPLSRRQVVGAGGASLAAAAAGPAFAQGDAPKATWPVSSIPGTNIRSRHSSANRSPGRDSPAAWTPDPITVKRPTGVPAGSWGAKPL